MGKSRKSRNSGDQRRKQQPTGLPSVEETLKADAESGGVAPLDLLPGGGRSGIPSSIDACVEQLQSHESVKKECGLLTLAELSGQSESWPIFRELRLTRHVAPHVLDPEESVRAAAVATLSAMATGGEGEDVAETMVNDDVMTPVVALFNKFFPSGWTPGSSSKSKDVFVNAVYLVRSLCETSPSALRVFNRDDVILSLITATDVKVYTNPVVAAVCECLLTVTESNPPAIQSIRQNEEALRNLQLLVQSWPFNEPSHENSDFKNVLTSITVAGVLLNVSDGNFSSLSPPIQTAVMTLIPAIMKTDVETFVAQLKRLAPKGKSSNASVVERETEEPMEEEMNGNANDGHRLPKCEGEMVGDGGMEEVGATPDDDDAAAAAVAEDEDGEVEGTRNDGGSPNVLPKSHRSKTLERISDLLSAQQMALEILTNICSPDDWEDDDDDENSSISSDGQPEAGGSREDLTMEEAGNLTLPCEVRDALASTETISTIVRCCGSSFSESLTGLDDFLDLAQARLLSRKMRLVQTRALTALNNLVASEVTSLGSVEDLVNLFTELTAVLKAIVNSDCEAKDLLEATTSAVRAVVVKIAALDKSSASSRPRLFAPALPDVDALLAIYQSAGGDNVDDRSVKINVVRISSALAASAHVKLDSPETFSTIGAFLLSAALDDDVAIAAEALDAIFDVFGDDDDCGENMRQVETDIRLVARLQDLIPAFHEKFRLQRKRLGPEQKAVVQTVKTNLLPFIAYKSQGK